MSETTLRFLMADGAMSATFSPALTPDHYAELHALIQHPTTKDELRLAIERAARLWGVKVNLDSEAV